MQKPGYFVMKSTQLLSVVLSLIMFTGVTAGSAAFADSDDLDDILETYCEMTLDEQSAILSDYELTEYKEKLEIICEIEDEDEREDALEDLIDAMVPETRDYVEDDREEDYDDDKDKDYDKYDIDDLLEKFCGMNDEEKRQLFADFPRLAQFKDRLADYCDLSEDEQDAVKDLLENYEDEIRDNIKRHAVEYKMSHDKDMREKLEQYCEMSDEDREAFVSEHDKAEDHAEKMNEYCSLDEDERDAYIDKYKDKYSNKGHGNLRDHFAMYCDMTTDERAEKMQMHDDLPDDLRADLARYCEMSEDEQDDFRDSMMDRMDMLKDHMKDKMMDKKSHMDYDRLCALSESDLAAEIDDSEKLDRISDWCEMTPEEREDYKKEHYDDSDKKHDFDGMSDMAKDRMSDVAKDKLHDKMKMSDKSDRLKAMIMDKRDISDERYEEIKMKFKEKHGDLTDERKSELKMKYKSHMASMKFEMTDERKSMIHDRLAEMKAFKAELREKSTDMTDEQKQELREEFIENAKDLQLAWITPRTQMTAGVDAAEVECREGFSLVMKASNGVAMCLKADTALEMIDRGIVVPAK